MIRTKGLMSLELGTTKTVTTFMTGAGRWGGSVHHPALSAQFLGPWGWKMGAVICPRPHRTHGKQAGRQ